MSFVWGVLIFVWGGLLCRVIFSSLTPLPPYPKSLLALTVPGADWAFAYLSREIALCCHIIDYVGAQELRGRVGKSGH